MSVIVVNGYKNVLVTNVNDIETSSNISSLKHYFYISMTINKLEEKIKGYFPFINEFCLIILWESF